MKTYRMLVLLALLALATALVALPGATSPSRVLAAPLQASEITSNVAPLFNPGAPTVSDSGWYALAAGLNGPVNAIAVSGQDIYVGGSFTDAGGNPNADHIARWNGSFWNALGTGLNADVSTIEVDGYDVYAAGPFTDAGGNSAADRIARWNASTNSWYPVGSSDVTYSVVSDIAVIGSYVYVTGQINLSADQNKILRWNNSTSSWEHLGSGLSGTPGIGYAARAMAVIGNNLYVGGSFTIAGGIASPGVARWDGSTWYAVGSGLNNEVWALAAAGTNLYAGGNFTSAGGDSNANSIARWDGAAWHAIGGTAPATVYSIGVAEPYLYVVGGQYSRYPYRWNGSYWQMLGAPPGSGHMHTVAMSEQGVYFGGDFGSLSGNSSAHNIALWKAMRLLPDSIVYSRNASGPIREIRAVDANGSNDQLLFNGTFPRLSPSRNQIAFLRPGSGAVYPNSRYDLYVRNLATGAESLVYDNDDYLVGFDWMSDNLHIVFDVANIIARKHVDGTGWEGLVTTGPLHPDYNDAPVFNGWDANRALAFHNAYVGILTCDKYGDIYGGAITHVPNTLPHDFWPAWSSDGQWIAFARMSSDDPYAGGNYFKIHPNGTGLTQLTFLSGDSDNHLHGIGTWDSQKDHIVAPGTVNGQAGMYAIATNGSGSIMRIPALYGAQADFVGAVIGDVKSWLYLPAIFR